MDEHRDFKYGIQVDHSKYQPMEDKLSLKGAWACHVIHFNLYFLPPPKKKTSLERPKLETLNFVH